MNLSDYAACRLCPRDCGAARLEGVAGQCGETAVCRVSSMGPHLGEEPSFSGTRGSGTVFFTGCSSHCMFCQNYQISNENLGSEMTADALVSEVRKLAASGVHNINFVTPDHFWPHVEQVCRALRAEGLKLPFLFNSSGYQRADMIDRYAEEIDIFMPDFKFADGTLAKRCMGDEQYPEVALAALRRMIEQKGFLAPWDPSGIRTAEQGVLVRHLILPGEIENSLRVLRLLRDEFGRLLPLSVMSQYHPVPTCAGAGSFGRRITAVEHERVRECVLDLDFRHIYMQTLDDTLEFLPDFERDQPFEGNRGG